jgi:hypothetical protein
MWESIKTLLTPKVVIFFIKKEIYFENFINNSGQRRF